jgi:membrane associated rhomboid family serine protease
VIGPRRTAIAAASLLVLVHLVATFRHGFALPDSLRSIVGASPNTTLTRPWALFAAPFFHDDFFHLGYNLAVLAATLPVALEAVGPLRGLAAAYLASPVASAFVNLALILPWAALGWGWAEAAVNPRLVGASVVIFAAAGIALATRDWSTRTRALVAVGYLAYETVLAVTGTTRPFVGVYHVTGFALGLLLGARGLP